MNFWPTKLKIALIALVLLVVYLLLPPSSFIPFSRIGSNLCPTEGIFGKPLGVYGSAICWSSNPLVVVSEFSLFSLVIDVLFFLVIFLLLYTAYSLMQEKR